MVDSDSVTFLFMKCFIHINIIVFFISKEFAYFFKHLIHAPMYSFKVYPRWCIVEIRKWPKF